MSLIGIFGGTFNPIHNGHLFMARQARRMLGLERVLFMPAGVPPLKDDDLAPAEARLKMVELAVVDEPGFEVLDMEVRRPGISYTVDTAQELSERFRGHTLVFIMGMDAFLDLPRWKGADRLLSLVDVAVLLRQPFSVSSLVGLPWFAAGQSLDPLELEQQLAPGSEARRHLKLCSGRSLWLLAVRPMDVSATEVRARLKRGDSCGDSLPPAVECFIISKGLYDTDRHG